MVETTMKMMRVTMTLVELQEHHIPPDGTGCHQAMEVEVEAMEDHLMVETMEEKISLEDPSATHIADTQCQPQDEPGCIHLAYRQWPNTTVTRCIIGSYDCVGITYLIGYDHRKE
jgi:hypothetical protein